MKPWAGRANGRTPFHTVGDYEVYETDREKSFYVQDTRSGASYAGDLAGVRRWIEARTK